MSDICLCRFCGGDFFQPALLNYPEAPQSAQGFLDDLDQPDALVDLKIYQCSGCGLVQHSLLPVSYHRDVIRAIAYSTEMAAFRAEQLNKWIQHFDLQNKNVLEIGCGKGEYLDLLMQSGAQKVFGLENAEPSIQLASQRGFNVKQGYLSLGFSNPWPFKFEAFAIFSFLEHWPDLKGSFNNLHTFLNDGACGLIEVPNFDFIIKNRLYSEFITDHIFYFDKTSLRTVLDLCGFEVQSIESIWHDYILSARVKKRSRLDVREFKTKQTEIVAQLLSFTGRFQPQDIVIWGAGHQSLAVIALANLQDQISHVVDSAEFKQHKYTPASHLLIKPPVSLLQDNPRAIVIMAAAYSDEVATTILQQYSSVKNIAILREDHLEIIRDER
jgi:SAM-dependent methyltransferase